jgi:hypothetical protein
MQSPLTEYEFTERHLPLSSAQEQMLVEFSDEKTVHEHNGEFCWWGSARVANENDVMTLRHRRGKSTREETKMTPHQKEELAEAKKAMTEIQGVCQGIGTTAAMARRCDIDSKLGQERWKIYTDLNNQACDLKYSIRLAFTILENVDEAAQELAKIIMDASLLWTGEDEEKNPGLKKARTLAGLLLNKSREDHHEKS